MKTDKIYCVVVTFNRLELLKENLTSLKEQTYPVDKFIIVNNCSTDGTTQYLEQFTDNNRFRIINLPKNVGGSGGFSTGIKEAVLGGCDWVWVMDDDTIPTPSALEHLARHTDMKDNTGFIGSKVIWTDGSSHLMNLPTIDTFFKLGDKDFAFNSFSDKGALLINGTSFVSVLISAKAVREVGLPFFDFFIWGDDVEYTDRITKHGFYGLYIDKSIVVHKTAVNYTANLVTAPDNVAWKFFYEIRNSMFVRRRKKKKFIPFFLSSLNILRKDLKKIKSRKSGNKAYRKAIIAGFRAGLSFKPTIEYLH